MNVTTGSRWRSQACTTEVIVVRAEAGDVDLRCGGHPMVAPTDAAESFAPVPEFAEGSSVGKRYELEAIGLELLVTKAGAGSLAVGDAALALKAAKRLPSSD